MNTSRISIISLTIVLIAISALVLPVNTALADHCKGKHKKDPGCDGGGDPPSPSIVYTVKLTGAFEFERDMTLNSKGNQLKSELEVEIDRPPLSSMFLAVWNNVFSKCPLFFEPTPVNVPGFMAPAGRKGWRIDKSGGVRVNFGGIPVSQDAFDGFLIPDSAWVNLALIGDIPFSDSFPPSEVTLSHFQIYGQTEAGVTPRLACDDKNFETEDLLEPIFLTITGPN